MKEVWFITGNKGKFSEAKAKCSTLDIKLVQKDLGYPEIQGDTLEEVIQYGIKYLQNRCSQPFIIEDAGLFINALQGFPGVYSKYVFFTIGLKGILQLLDGVENRTATFRSVYAYVEPTQQPTLFIGECQGHLSPTMKGSGGFGYDPLFIPNTETRTFAEMSVEEKNRYSHRGKALDNLIHFLQTRRKDSQ